MVNVQTKPHMPWLRLVLVCGLLLMAACSSTGFVYNRLDFLLPWYLDDYVDLNREQSQQLDALLTPFLDWHRQHEMPRYASLVDELRATLSAPVTVDDLASVADDARTTWLRTEKEGLLDLVGFGFGFVRHMRGRNTRPTAP